MTNTTNNWKLGLFVVVGVVAIVGILGWLGVRRLEREVVISHYFFDETVDGLDIGAPVKFRGVPLGRVIEIKAAEDKRNVHVIAEIYVDVLDQLGLMPGGAPTNPEDGPWVPPDLRVQLKSSLLTGVTYIQGDFFDSVRHPIPEYPFEVPFETVHSIPSTGKTLELGIEEVLLRLPGLLDEAVIVMKRVEGGIDDLDLASLSARTGEFVDRADMLLKQIEDSQTVAQTTATMREAELAAAELRVLASEIRDADGPLARIVKRYDALAEVLADGVEGAKLAETAAVVRQLGGNASRTADTVTHLSEELRREFATLGDTLDSMNRLFKMLEHDPSSLLYGRESSSVLGRNE